MEKSNDCRIIARNIAFAFASDELRCLTFNVVSRQACRYIERYFEHYSPPVAEIPLARSAERALDQREVLALNSIRRGTGVSPAFAALDSLFLLHSTVPRPMLHSTRFAFPPHLRCISTPSYHKYGGALAPACCKRSPFQKKSEKYRS